MVRFEVYLRLLVLDGERVSIVLDAFSERANAFNWEMLKIRRVM